MSEALKECPCCGNKDVTLWPMGKFQSPLCESCGLTVEEAVTGEDTKAQIKAWNTRRAPDRVEEARARVIEAALKYRVQVMESSVIAKRGLSISEMIAHQRSHDNLLDRVAALESALKEIQKGGKA